MDWLTYILAQTTVPAAGGAAGTMPGGAGASGLQAVGGFLSPAGDGGSYTVDWGKWIHIHSWQTGVASVATLILIVLLGLILTRAFRAFLERHELLRPVRWGTLALGIYAALLVVHHTRMLDPHDVLALIFHKVFVAVMLLVALRFFDRLVVIPILTRGGRVTLSRFVHQIILAILGIFLAAAYAHWAFEVDVSSVLAGSAVISIVLGLALQETLGNFFSGMVIQASVPFAPGDWILVGEKDTAVEGRVVEMTWRAVTIATPSNNNVLIPNSTMARTKITNYHTPSPATGCSITMALDVGLQPHEARRVLLLAARDTAQVLATPAPSVSIASYGSSSITYSVGFWIDKPDQHAGVEAAVRWNAWYRLRQAGVSIPYDTKTIYMGGGAERGRVAADSGSDSGMADRLEAIEKNPLFSRLSAEQKQKLAAEIRDYHMAAGQYFFRQDDPGDSCYLILSGTVRAVMRSEDGRDIELGDTESGGVFGDVSAVTGHPRTASVIAKTDVRVAEITHEHLHALLAKEPSLAKHMAEVVAQSQARREELSKQMGAEHRTHGQNTVPHSVLDRMRAFLRF